VAHRVALGTIVALAVLALGAPPGAATAPGSSARGAGVLISVPNGTGSEVASVSAPPRGAAALESWSSHDGAVTTGAISTVARTGTDSASSTGTGRARVNSVSLFGGEITAEAVDAEASALAWGRGADGSLEKSSVSNLVVLGDAVDATSNDRIELGDWGYVIVLEKAVTRQTSARFGYRGFVTGLHVVLTSAHAGLPAGTEIRVGYAEAAASAPKPEPPPAPPSPPPPPKHSPPTHEGTSPPPPPREPEPPPSGAVPQPPHIVKQLPQDVQPELTDAGYVFPVYGPSSFSDDFAAARATTGWHHGNDIFAPLGAPVLAVADGSLFLVGWNEIGGNRLWLRDRAGNGFYYAHLSAYAPIAEDGAQVKAGDVIGFVGTSGDAAGTPPHLHFEIHPRELFWMGYDGVIDPYPYLIAWLKLRDIAFGAWKPAPGKAPQAGAVLLQSEDISSLSGLGDDTLASYLVMPELFGEEAREPAVVGAKPGFAGG
jgi:murein DD-endopeptidase MepM/ murein hydrolase activator NlpD